MKQFVLGLTLGILVTGMVVRAADKSLEIGTTPIPMELTGNISSYPTVHCGSISPEALEQIRKTVRP